MKTRYLLFFFVTVISACGTIKPALILKSGDRTFKAEISYCTCGTRDLNVYLRDKSGQETYWEFGCLYKFNTLQPGPYLRQKQIRPIQGGKVKRMRYYQAIADTSNVQVDMSLTKEDSIVFFQILPLLKEGDCFQNTLPPQEKGFKFVKEYSGKFKSRYRKIKLK
jgi:hypothetical protein